MPDLAGILFIGDPHLASRPPGFRKDDYPAVILEKLRWSLDYARENRLLPILLGDLFDYPRDNANWLLTRLFSLLDGTLAISGNHDCKENTLDDNDTLKVLIAGGAIRLVDGNNLWTGNINTRPVIIGGTSWGQPLPKCFDSSSCLHPSSFVFWVTHHDLRFPGYEDAARFDCREIPGIDVIVNGHIHRNLGQVQAGKTLWINPGNIARLARSDATRVHVPSILRADISATHCELTRITVPHRPYEEVFHAEAPGQNDRSSDSIFIRALAELESVRTASGAGLRQFLDANLTQFDKPVAEEIQLLAREVLQDAR
jgi:predicted phosphodiesterase